MEIVIIILFSLFLAMIVGLIMYICTRITKDAYNDYIHKYVIKNMQSACFDLMQNQNDQQLLSTQYSSIENTKPDKTVNPSMVAKLTKISENFTNCPPNGSSCVDSSNMSNILTNLVNEINKWKIHSDKIMFINNVIPSYGYDKLNNIVSSVCGGSIDIAPTNNKSLYDDISNRLKTLDKAIDFIDKTKVKNTETFRYVRPGNKELFTNTKNIETFYDIVNDTYTSTDKRTGESIHFYPSNPEFINKTKNKNLIENHLINLLKISRDSYKTLLNNANM